MQLSFNRLALLTIAGCALFATAADAAQPYADGDIILAFRATINPNSSYLYNLGPAVNFTGHEGTQLTLSDLNISQDLTNTFGANWFNRSDLFWSLSGVQTVAGDIYVKNTMFVSAPEMGPLVYGSPASQPWEAISGFGAGDPALKIQSMSQRYGFGSDSTSSVESAFNNFGLIQPNGEINSFRSFAPGGGNTTGATYYGRFAGGGLEGNFGSGIGGAALDLYTLEPNAGPATFEGNVTISNTGALTFTPQGVVPEPASAAVLAAGALVLSLRRRRATV